MYRSFWKLEVLQTKASQTLVFDPSGSTGHLRAWLFLEMWRALLCGEVLVWTLDGTRGWSGFWQKDDLEYNFSRDVQATRYTERIVADCCLSAARLFPGSWKSQTAGGYASCGDKLMPGNAMERGAWWQGTPRSAWWRVRFGAERIRCFLHIVKTESTHLSSLYEWGIILFLEGGVSCVIFSDGTPVIWFCFFPRELCLYTRTNREIFERKLHFLTSRIATLSTASARSGRVLPENSSIAIVVGSERWNWGGYYRC